jgi:hypothetical protein
VGRSIETALDKRLMLSGASAEEGVVGVEVYVLFFQNVYYGYTEF